mmetsp:Transcript_6522/g.16236  ORF Transcript_6522/g.16236 Transcript_6522/m.16236 type:complete len:153 (+) Transcript_6522:66-524(+)
MSFDQRREGFRSGSLPCPALPCPVLSSFIVACVFRFLALSLQYRMVVEQTVARMDGQAGRHGEHGEHGIPHETKRNETTQTALPGTASFRAVPIQESLSPHETETRTTSTQFPLRHINPSIDRCSPNERIVCCGLVHGLAAWRCFNDVLQYR